jgi:thiosulfate sulfurtransferase
VKRPPEITIEEAREKLDKGTATFVDVRGPGSYDRAHIPGAIPITDGNIQHFIESTDKERPVIVYCYHGNSSLAAASYLLEHGFKKVYSMVGGFEGWRWNNPTNQGAL